MICELLRELIIQANLSKNIATIAREAKVSQSVIYEMMSGRELNTFNADKLCAYFRLALVPITEKSKRTAKIRIDS